MQYSIEFRPAVLKSLKRFPKKDLVKIKKKIEGGELEGKSFCFSGFRDNNLEESIKRNGGRINSGVSRKLTYLVVKNKNTTTEKIKKALSYGTVLLEPSDVECMINPSLF